MAFFTPPPPASFLLAQQVSKTHQSLPQQSAGQQPPQQQPTYLSSAMLFLDITTFQGLLLYTLYFMHRLRFFRWKDARTLSQILVGTHRSLELDHKDSTASNSVHGTGTHEVETRAFQEEQEEGCCSALSPPSTASSSMGTTLSINERLPPEILTLVFEQVARPRTLLKCMLVCREWYLLLGPRIWKSPRVLWSRRWSRFFPHSDMVTTGLSRCDDLEDREVTPQGQLSPLQPEQPYRRREYNSPAEALASGQLHDLDRQELERWLEWKKRERIQRIRDVKRRRQLAARRSRGREGSVLRDTGHGDEEDTEDGDWDSFDEHDASEGSRDSESEVEYDTEDDETALMKVISGIDYLRTLLRHEHDHGSVSTASNQLSQQPAKRSIKAPCLFSTVLVRARQQQALKECRCRLARIQESDGLPASLPLSTCGQWIQVINLQQETPFPQPTSPQSFMHPPPIPSRARQQRTHTQHPQQPPLDPTTTPLGFLTSFFAARARDRADPLSNRDLRLEPARLRSRRDDISDRSLQTILDSCPGLCRLTLSECHGITDAGMRMIYNSTCVAQGTLVSLHMAGCHQITDQGLLHLIGLSAPLNINKDYHRPRTSDDPLRQPRFESLDLAGCYGVTDRGLIPVLEQCGAKLTQLRVSDCEGVTLRSVQALAQYCPAIQWLDLARSGRLTTECLLLLAERCSDLEWLNLARTHLSDLDIAAAGAAAGVQGWEHQDLTDDDGEDDDGEVDEHVDDDEDDGNDDEEVSEKDTISDLAISVLCELCPKLQLLDLSYIPTVTNGAIEALSESAQSLVCLTIIGCPGITSQSLVHLAKLRRSSGKLGCITMGDALGISERDIEEIMQGTLSGWQKSLVDETNLGEILGRSWDE